MPNKILLVDLENVQKIDLAKIPSGVRVLVFFGATQKSVTSEYLKSALKLGESYVHIDIHGQGKNALDFHIAFYLGEYLVKTPTAEFVILSKDKGFDPLVEHLRRRSFNVRRESDLAEACKANACVNVGAKPNASVRAKPNTNARPKAGAAKEPIYQRILDLLTKMEKKVRPRKRKRLLAHMVNSIKNVPATDIEKAIEQLFAGGVVSEAAANGALSYTV